MTAERMTCVLPFALPKEGRGEGILPGPHIYFSESALAARRLPTPKKEGRGSGREYLFPSLTLSSRTDHNASGAAEDLPYPVGMRQDLVALGQHATDEDHAARRPQHLAPADDQLAKLARRD